LAFEKSMKFNFGCIVVQLKLCATIRLFEKILLLLVRNFSRALRIGYISFNLR